MLTTTATISFLLVTSGLAALAVHETLGSGRRNRGGVSSDALQSLRAEIAQSQQADVEEAQSLIGQLRAEHEELAAQLERRAQASTKEGARHEAGLAAAFNESRNGQAELRTELEQMNRMMAEISSQAVNAGRDNASCADVEALGQRMDALEAECRELAAGSSDEERLARIERSLQDQDMRLCTLDDSINEVVQSLAPDNTDLKRIKGIGAALEKTLKGLGVETVDQVANISIDDIEVLSEQLGSFASRIERDCWIDQARELIGAK